MRVKDDKSNGKVVRQHVGEWISMEDAAEWKRRYDELPDTNGQDVGERRRLRKEFQKKYGLGELEAFNILRGYHTADYVAYYERWRYGDPNPSSKDGKENNSGKKAAQPAVYVEEVQWVSGNDEDEWD